VGTGRRSAEPDALELVLELSAREPRVAEAISRLAEATGRLATILEAQGIPASDLRTRALDVDPWHGRMGEQLGHVARRMTMVRLRELDQVGRLLLAAADLGDGLQVGRLRWTSSLAQKLTAEARELAVQDALSRASEMARAARLTLGRVLRLEEIPDSLAFPAPRGRLRALTAGSVQLELDPGELEYTVLVRLRCRLRGPGSGGPGRRPRREPVPPGRR
jgi:uncharacterized protein YggE